MMWHHYSESLLYEMMLTWHRYRKRGDTTPFVLSFFISFSLIVFSMQVREMDPQLHVAPEDHPSSVGYKPILFMGANAWLTENAQLGALSFEGLWMFCQSTIAFL